LPTYFFLVGIFIGYDEFRRILAEIKIQAEIIKFGNRIGFIIVGIVIPVVHFIGAVDYFWPKPIQQNKRALNISLIILCIALLITAFSCSSWMKSKVENAGYIYCRNDSGISALAKILIYTKDMEICEALVAAQHERK